MNSFYGLQRGLFTFYIENDEREEELQRIYHEKIDNFQLPSKQYKPQPNKLKQPSTITKLKQIINPKQYNKRNHNHNSKIQLTNSLEMKSKINRQSLQTEQDKNHIFLPRKSHVKTNRIKSVEYRVLEQRPIATPNIIMNQQNINNIKEKKNSIHQSSTNRLKTLERKKSSNHNRYYLPPLTNNRLINDNKNDQKQQKSSLTRQQLSLNFVFDILNVQSNPLNSIRIRSQAKMKKKSKQKKPKNIVSYIELPKKDDPHREIARWQQLRKQVIKRYHFPL